MFAGTSPCLFNEKLLVKGKAKKLRKKMRLLLTDLPLLLLLLLCGNNSKVVASRMTPIMRREALEAHNYLRRNVYPEAIGMARLSWSTHLEALAERAAQTCVFEHSTAPEYAGKGENMYLGGKDNFTEILTMMYLERELYSFENSRCLAGTGEYNGPYRFFSTCGHYLQIVRADMTQVGCSINPCPNADGSVNFLAVCEYESVYKEPPYRARKPFEQPCDLCGFEGYATTCEDDMCTVLDPKRPPRIRNVRRKCLNCGEMQYYGEYDFCLCRENFYGEVCESRIQNSLSRSFERSCNKCQQEGIRCMNGGRPVVRRDQQCHCRCRAGYSGQYCEVNNEEEANTLRLYLGGGKRYLSYFPVEKSTWNAISGEVSLQFSIALSNYCTRGRARVGLSANYPATTINGRLQVGLHAKCGAEYISKQQLKTAFEESTEIIDGAVRQAGVSVVEVE